MAVAYGSASLAVYSQTNPVVTLPTGNSGDGLLLVVMTKPDNTPADPISGWTLLGAFTSVRDGLSSGSTTADSGSVRVGVFFREADGTEPTSITVNVPSNNVTAAQIFRYSKGGGEAWDVQITGGGDTSAGTAFSILTGTVPASWIAAGDHLLVPTVLATDTAPTWGTPTLTAQGGGSITLGTATVLQTYTTTTQGDLGGRTIRYAPSASTQAAGTLTFASTLSGTTTNAFGATAIVRLRAAAPTTIQKSASDTSSVSISDTSSKFVFQNLRTSHVGMWHSAHRGAGESPVGPWPEETMEAYAKCFADPNIDVLEMDVRLSSDGILYLSHDANIDRLYTTNATVEATSSTTLNSQSYKASLLVGTEFEGQTLRLAKLTDILALYHDKILLSIEPKTQAAGDALPAVLDQYMIYKQNVSIPSFDEAYQAASVAAGYPIALRPANGTAPSVITAKGGNQVNVNINNADAAWQAQLAAGGVEMWVWTIDSQYDHDRAVAMNANGIIGNDPPYIQRAYRQTGDPYADQHVWHGYISGGALNGGTNGRFVSPDQWGIDNNDGVTSNVESGVLQGWINPINNNPTAQYYTIDFEANMVDNLANASNFTVAIANRDDNGYAGGSSGTPAFRGYNCLFRKSGVAQVRTFPGDGTDTTAATITGTALTVNTWNTYQIIVTPNDITAKNLTLGTTVTSTEVGFGRGGYIWFGAAGSNTLFRNITVTDNTPAGFVDKNGSDTSSISVAMSAVAGELGAATPISASDTGGMALSGVAAIQASFTKSDTSSVVVSDSASILKTIPASDTSSVAVTDVSAIQKNFTASDTSSVAAADTSTIAVTLTRADTSSVAAADTSALQKGLSASDTSSVSVTESVAINVFLTRDDPTSLSVSDASATLSTNPRSDTSSVAIADSAVVAGTVNRADTAALTITDTAVIDSSGLGSDQASVTATDVATVAGSTTRTDTGAVAIGETASIAVSTTATDTLPVSITEARQVAVTTTANDTTSLAIADTSVIDKFILASDTGAVSVADSSSITITSQDKSASDTSSIAVSESVANAVSLSANDSANIGVADITLIHKTILAADVSSISIDDDGSRAATGTNPEVSDTLEISSTETAQVSASFLTSDTGAVATTDVSSTSIATTKTDTGSISVSDTSHVLKNPQASDTGSVSATDASSVAVTRLEKFSSDSGSLVATDASQFSTVPLSASDAATLQIADVSGVSTDTSFLTPAASDTLTTISTDSSSIVISGLVLKSASDSGALTISDVSTRDITAIKAASDSGSVAATDASGGINVGGTVTKSTTDTDDISITDTSSIAVTRIVTGTDTGAFSIDDDGLLEPVGTAPIGSSDSGSVSVSDTASVTITTLKTASDTSGVVITDVGSKAAFNEILKNAGDTAAVSISETATRFFAQAGGRISFDFRWSYAIMLNRGRAMLSRVEGTSAQDKTVEGKTDGGTQIEGGSQPGIQID